MNSTTTPKTVTTLASLRREVAAARGEGRRVGFVPTMGALHEGHLSLVRACKAECDLAVVSIFVNPTQFGPGEDLDRYPRTLEADVARLTECGANLVFAPSDDQVYRPGHDTWVEVDKLSRTIQTRGLPMPGAPGVISKLSDAYPH